MDCVFCKIIKKELASDIVFENEEIIAFKDIHPKASVHILVAPKKHIISFDNIGIEDRESFGELMLTAKEIARKNNLLGYKLVINVGREGGQMVDHLHIHLLGGKIEEIP